MSRFTCSCGAILEESELGGHLCPASGPMVPVHEVPLASGRPPSAAGAPRPAPGSPFSPWMFALLIGAGVAITVPVVLLMRPSPGPDTAAAAELERLRANLEDVEKKLAAIKNGEASPERERRIRELQSENETLTRAAEQNSQTIRDLRARLQELSPAPPPPKAVEAAAPAAAGDPVLQALRLSIVDVVVGGDRWYGLAIDSRFVITRLAGLRNASRVTVVYYPDSSDRRQQTSCSGSLFAADMVNGLALLAIEPMAPVKPVVLDFNVPLREGDTVFTPVQRHGASALDFDRRRGKVQNLSVEVSRIDCIEAAIPFGMALTGVPLALEDGRIVGLVIASPGTAPDTVAAVPVSRIIKFFERRGDACYRVLGTLDEHELASAPLFAYDPSTALKVGTDITQIVANRETGQLLCLEPKNNGVIVVSPAGGIVSRSLFTGTDPTFVATAAGQRTFWVANAASKNFVRIDAAAREPIELTIPVSFAPKRFLVSNEAIFAESASTSSLHVITLNDKRECKFQAHIGSGLVYNPKTGQLVGFTGAFRTSGIALEKVLAFARQDANLRAEDYAGRMRLAKSFTAAVTHYQPALGGVNFPLGNFGQTAFFDDGGRRLYCNQIVFEGHRLDAVVAALRPAPSLRLTEGALRSLKARYPDIHGIQSASPDGKWFATGLHLYSAENFEVKEELPVPSPLSVFSKDSKTLYLYDPWNGYVVPMKIE